MAVMRWCIIAALLPVFAFAAEITVRDPAKTQDGGIRENFNTYNYGAATTMQTLNSAGLNRKFIVSFDLDTIGADMVIDSFSVILYCETLTDVNTAIACHQMFKPYYEGTGDHSASGDGAIWDGWYSTDSAWGTAGVNNANDGGSPNRANGSDYDRTSTAFVTADVDATGSVTFVFNAAGIAWANDVYDGTIGADQSALVFSETSTVGINIWTTSEGATAGNRPAWRAVYHAAAGASPSSRRRRIISGGD